MRITVVPNRNALMLDIAVAVAVTAGCDTVAFGTHAGDHAVYPDCRPEFVDAFTVSARLADDGFLPERFRVVAPFLSWTKADIVRLGAARHRAWPHLPHAVRSHIAPRIGHPGLAAARLRLARGRA